MDCKFFHCDQREGEWCEKYPIPRCHNRGGCEYEEEGKRKESEWSDEDLKNEEIRCNLLQHLKSQVDLSKNWNGIKITDIISWLQSLKDQVAPAEEKNSGCECEDEGKTNTVAKVDENKKIEEICDYIFKYEHYNSFYQYAVACAKAVAEWKNIEITELKWRNNYEQ